MAKIIYEDSLLLIVHKPIKMLTHPDKKNLLPNLLADIKHPDYHVITRLDANTSGLVLIAKNAQIASELNEMSKSGLLRKQYAAVVVGKMAELEDTLVAYHSKDEVTGKVLVSLRPFEGAKEMRTKYRVLKEKGRFSLLEVDLETGKAHQIRAHLALLGHPILGDPLYGNLKVNKENHVRTQLLNADLIAFGNISETHALHYLSNKVFVDSEGDINQWFR